MVTLDVTFNMPDPTSQLTHGKNMEPDSKIISTASPGVLRIELGPQDTSRGS